MYKPSYDIFKDEETDRIQFRFYLEDDDPTVFNKHLIINKGYFTERFFMSYERKFERDGKLVYESYYDDVLTMYSETEDTPECTTDQHFAPDGSIFMELKYFKDADGKPVTIEEREFDAKGVEVRYARYPYGEVYGSSSGKPTEDESF
jgi:uncharacterized protein YkuJ